MIYTVNFTAYEELVAHLVGKLSGCQLDLSLGVVLRAGWRTERFL